MIGRRIPFVVIALLCVMISSSSATDSSDVLRMLRQIDDPEESYSVKEANLRKLSEAARSEMLVCSELARRIEKSALNILAVFEDKDHPCREHLLEIMATTSSREMWPLVSRLSKRELLDNREYVATVLLRGDKSLAAALAWQIGIGRLKEFRKLVAKATWQYSGDEFVTLADGHVRDAGLVYAVVLGTLLEDDPCGGSGSFVSARGFLLQWLESRRRDYCDDDTCDGLYDFAVSRITGAIKRAASDPCARAN